MREPQPVTALLQRWREGDVSALDELMRLVYAELRRLAASHLRGERAATSFTPTALVSEAYLRLAGGELPAWNDRAHFFAAAARHMRHVLVDHARTRARKKRGAGVRPVTFDDSLLGEERSDDVLVLDEALTALAKLDERKARVVELHFFGGLQLAEIAEVLAIHTNTVLRDLRFAEAWLHRYFTSAPEPSEPA